MAKGKSKVKYSGIHTVYSKINGNLCSSLSRPGCLYLISLFCWNCDEISSWLVFWSRIEGPDEEYYAWLFSDMQTLRYFLELGRYQSLESDVGSIKVRKALRQRCESGSAGLGVSEALVRCLRLRIGFWIIMCWLKVMKGSARTPHSQRSCQAESRFSSFGRCRVRMYRFTPFVAPLAIFDMVNSSSLFLSALVHQVRSYTSHDFVEMNILVSSCSPRRHGLLHPSRSLGSSSFQPSLHLRVLYHNLCQHC
jgi:hypothetical protein